MTSVRELQIELLRSWTPAERLGAAARMIDLALEFKRAREAEVPERSVEPLDSARDRSD